MRNRPIPENYGEWTPDDLARWFRRVLGLTSPDSDADWAWVLDVVRENEGVDPIAHALANGEEVRDDMRASAERALGQLGRAPSRPNARVASAPDGKAKAPTRAAVEERESYLAPHEHARADAVSRAVAKDAANLSVVREYR